MCKCIVRTNYLIELRIKVLKMKYMSKFLFFFEKKLF